MNGQGWSPLKKTRAGQGWRLGKLEMGRKAGKGRARIVSGHRQRGGQDGPGGAGGARGGQGGPGRGQGQGAGTVTKKRILAKSAPRTGLEPPRSLLEAPGALWAPFRGGPKRVAPSRIQGLGFRVFTLLRDQYWSRGEPVPVPGPIVGATVFRAAGGGRASWVDLRHRGRGA